MRTTKCFKVVKCQFYINSPLDWGNKIKTIKKFKTLNEAEIFCEDNLKKYCKDYHDELQIEQHFNEDKTIYVRGSYGL